MPVQDLNFLGINRAISDYSPSSACEELINLRPSVNGLVPVMPFGVKFGNTEYKKVFIHEASNKTNYIGVKLGQYTLDIDIIGESGHLYQIPAYSHLSVDHVHFAYAGNIILFSVTDHEDNYYQNIAYRWKESAYYSTSAAIPDFTPTILVDNNSYTVKTARYQPNAQSPSEGVESIASAFAQIQEENPSVCFGPVIIAIAFKTKGGDTFWTGHWFIFDPASYIRSRPLSTYVPSAASLPGNFSSLFQAFFSKYPQGGYVLFGPDNMLDPTLIPEVKLAGESIKLHIPQMSWWNDDVSMIASLEIYSSKPVSYENIKAILDNGDICLAVDTDTMNVMGLAPEMKYEEMDLSGQLLYLQQSIQMSDLKAGARDIPLTFGGSIQTTEDTLDVDSGMTTRFGEVMAYNARFHFFNSIAKTDIGVPGITKGQLSNMNERVYYFAIYQSDSMDTSEERYVGYEDMAYADASSNAKVVIAPSINIKEVVTFYPTNAAMTAGYIKKYRMVPSTAYNYSICVDGPYQTTGDASHYASLINGGVNRIIKSKETNAINVTEQYDPFVFLVEHSYYAPGKVLGIQPQMAQDRDTTFGPYPLNVFTTRGVYALMQGSSNVLYGSFWPVSNHVSDSNSISTEIGTFYIAAGGIWLVAGMHATLISVALSLGPHKYIRDCDGFQKLSTIGVTPGTYNVGIFLSTVPFKDYLYREYTEGGQTLISKATLSYNRFQEELYVSNPDYDYTYVLSVKYRQWFKISGSIWQDVPGSTIANRPGSSPLLMNIVDFAKENDAAHVIVHLQSRPVTFGMQYTHIHRIVTMIRSELGFNENLSYQSDTLIVALYGSDNLQDWNLLTYSQRAGTVETVESTTTRTPLKVSQVRTPSAARSWRYYTVCIGGRVQKDTDLGQVLVDHEPVVRRIG